MAGDKSILRHIPKVDFVLDFPGVNTLIGRYPRELVVEAVRKTLDEIRQGVLGGSVREELMENCKQTDLISTKVAAAVEQLARPKLRRVINATGVVLHTNLGRAVLSSSALEAICMAATGYSNLELNLENGKRGSRYASVEGLLSGLLGTQSSMVVNNNAAAVLLALNTLARGREVIVSRGQLVEIGGSFRVPEVMEQSGAVLREVGSTNKTYSADYRKAINDMTSLMLFVHTSNYKIVGFTKEIKFEELVELGREVGVPVMCDLGSGSLLDMEQFGLPAEPTVQQVVNSGVDIVTFSGDKLLGGPQAGIIAGNKELMDRMKKNPLTRALRVDKVTLAALEATLREYINKKTVVDNIPTLCMLNANQNLLLDKAEKLSLHLQKTIKDRAEISVEKNQSAVGGGALPTADLPGWSVVIKPSEFSVEELVGRLRWGTPSVIGRIHGDRLFLDVRTVLNGEDIMLAEALEKALERRE